MHRRSHRGVIRKSHASIPIIIAIVIVPMMVPVLLGNDQLDRILHSWKSYSAKQINKMANARGAVWHRESFDHMIRKSRSTGSDRGVYPRQSEVVASEPITDV